MTKQRSPCPRRALQIAVVVLSLMIGSHAAAEPHTDAGNTSINKEPALALGFGLAADGPSDVGVTSPTPESESEDIQSSAEQTGDQGSAKDDIEVEVGDVAEGDSKKKGFSWRYGLRYETKIGHLRLRAGGLFQYDLAGFQKGGSLIEARSGDEFRRARLVLEGAFRENGEFRVQYDFAGEGGKKSIRDLWVSLETTPRLGRIKFGKFKEPFGLEGTTSARDIVFMERALLLTFIPGRNAGVTLSNSVFDQRATWTLGAFRDISGDLEVDHESTGVTGRVTGLPWYNADEQKLLHLGAGYSYRGVNESDFSYRQRPEAHLAPEYLDTGGFEVDNLKLVSGEFALLYGPFSFQSEYFYSNPQSDAGANFEFDGLYAQASYFITGEHRPYRTATGTFGKVIPEKNFFQGGQHGLGAWEVALRYSQIDLNDEGITGGREQDVTTALNWYMNPNTRISINYIYGDIDSPGGNGSFHAVQTRFQIAF